MPDLRRHRPYSLFAYKPAAGVKILFFIAASIVLMTLDHRYHNVENIRSVLSTAMYPLRVVAALPHNVGHTLDIDLAGRRELLARNAALERQAIELQAKLQRMQALERENAELRALMEAAPKARGEVRVGEVMSINLDPFRQQLVINKGSLDGVYRGQPLLGAHGVMGQITHTDAFSSVAILITDPNTAIPVEIGRNGLRTIAVGTGDASRLELPYLPNNADIKVGDTFVTSGLGGRFPRGYPVGTVTRVVQNPGAPFAEVDARPAAEIDRSHEVLLLWPPNDKHAPAAKQIPAKKGNAAASQPGTPQ